MKMTIIFVVCSLLNVILSTLKTLTMVNCKRNVAIIINAIYYGFYTLVIKQLSSVDYVIAITVTVLSNIIGVWISYKIMDLFKKEKVWRITATLGSKEEYSSCVEKLKKYQIGYTRLNDTNCLDIYSYTKQESEIIKTILEEYKYKYFIQEMNNTL